MLFKTYCLTFKDSDRHLFCEKMFNEYHLNYQFVFAKKFSKAFVYNFLNFKNQSAIAPWSLSMFSKQKGYYERAFSCAEGHRRIMETFLNDDSIKWALVFEDDCQIGPNLVKQINYILNNFNYKFYHLAYYALGNYAQRLKDPTLEVEFKKEYCNPEIAILNKAGSTMAYLCNKDFALTYYRNLTPITMPSDITMQKKVFNFKDVPVVKNIDIEFSNFQKFSIIGNAYS